MQTTDYDPFAPGPFPVGVRTIEAPDKARDRVFPCEIWYPAGADYPPGADAQAPAPLVAYSHSSGGNRRSATFLCDHLARHGYVVAALDHSEQIAPELARRDNETDAERAARIDAVVANRVPDVRFLIDQMMDGSAGTDVDASRIGLVGHSFGGWTVLATAEVDPRVRAIVAHAPGGGASRPGLLPLTLSFAWDRDTPTLYLAAENDVPVPPVDVRALFDRTPAAKRMFTLRRADHQHFVDDVEGAHEFARAMAFPAPAAWIQAAMLPISELCSGAEAHVFVRGLTLAHLDASLRQDRAAQRFLAGDVEAELSARGVNAVAER